jgi:hypothetical protein
LLIGSVRIPVEEVRDFDRIRSNEEGLKMHCRTLMATAVLGIALAATGACTRETANTPETADVAAQPDRAAELRDERARDIAAMKDRVAEIEREYQQQTVERPRGTAGASAGLREEVQEDVKNVRQAVADLETTTAQNWWDRHEQAMMRTADDIEADVRRLSGTRAAPAPRDAAADARPGTASDAPFTSRRDRFVKDLRARVEAWDAAMEKVNARGARETELEDVRARRRKLAEDLDRLDEASADDWWDVSKARVNDYVDRVEKSIARLDDDSAARTGAAEKPAARR